MPIHQVFGPFVGSSTVNSAFALPTMFSLFPGGFGLEQSSFIMWHHHYQHGPKQIQSRLTKTFPGLYGSYPKDIDLTSAIEGHIAMQESIWAPKDWQDVDQTKTPWGWMLSVRNEHMIPESVVSKDGLGVQGENKIVEGGSPMDCVEVGEDESKESGDDVDNSTNNDGDNQQSDVYDDSGDQSKHEVDSSSNDSDNLTDTELVIDLDGINSTPDEENAGPACVEIYLDESTDYLVSADGNH